MLVDLGCEVLDAEPDFDGAERTFLTWRAWSFEARLGAHLDAHPELLGENVAWNIEQGRALTGRDLALAEQAHGALYHRIREFMREYEFVLAPVAQVPPFAFTTDHPLRIAGVEMTTYIDWMKSCWFISAVGLPAISVPCGFTPEGLPVGLQIVGRHRDDLGVLQIAHAFELATQHWRRQPTIAAPAQVR